MAYEATAVIPGINMQDLRLKGFKVHELSPSVAIPTRHGLRDFYKMGLVNGDMTIDYGGQLVMIITGYFLNLRLN